MSIFPKTFQNFRFLALSSFCELLKTQIIHQLLVFSYFLALRTFKKIYFAKMKKLPNIDKLALRTSIANFFFSLEVIFAFYNRNYPWKTKFMCQRHFWNFRNFGNFDNIWDFKCHFWRKSHKYYQFFRDFWWRWHPLHSGRVWG